MSISADQEEFQGCENKDPNPKQAYGDKKVPLHLCTPAGMAYEAMAMKHGAHKYGAWNFRQTKVEQMTYIGAALRHLSQYQDGESIDEESGVPHLGLAKACLGILIDSIENDGSIDNRPPKGRMTELLEAFAL